ncbi:MAG TPA: polyhydroxyalkanoic acid system family protein [Thermoanaerobaculia bacterium]|nr:polyhydroxyalkanoic acid system family protein [Thermoanaerobaculia bacterium]
MRITLPHHTTKDNARRIVDRKLDELQSQYSSYVNDVDKSWSGDTLVFSIKARGFTGKGTLEVTASEVILDGKLPLLAKPFEPRIKAAVEQEATQLFPKT